MSNKNTLFHLGWQAFFQQQLSLEAWETTLPARIIEQHRNGLQVLTEQGEYTLAITHNLPDLVVGDWVLLNQDKHFHSLLERKSLFTRKAAGTKLNKQLIAANVDTAFIVTSANHDFNLNRIERFLALVHEAEVEPVIVLSKCDLVVSTTEYETAIRQLDPFLMLEAINATDKQSVEQLQPWLQAGKTAVVLGSSGVGKSTLINTLLGHTQQSTSGIREDDSKGRHTTTRRSLISLPTGGLVLDTPGIRELQLSDCEEGLATTFADIEQLAQHCRFSDCQHESEPGCAIQRAIQAGELEPRRLKSYLKLQRENQFNSASLAQRRQSDRAFGKMVKQVLSTSKKLKGH